MIDLTEIEISLLGDAGDVVRKDRDIAGRGYDTTHICNLSKSDVEAIRAIVLKAAKVAKKKELILQIATYEGMIKDLQKRLENEYPS
jgi:hypothetical protein